jgi:hypothetical protein
MSEEQFAEAQRLFEVLQEAHHDEQWRMACLLTMKADGELFGQTEFEVRDRVLRMGAQAMEAAVNGRRKKRGMLAVAPSARTASTTPSL